MTNSIQGKRVFGYSVTRNCVTRATKSWELCLRFWQNMSQCSFEASKRWTTRIRPQVRGRRNCLVTSISIFILMSCKNIIIHGIFAGCTEICGILSLIISSLVNLHFKRSVHSTLLYGSLQIRGCASPWLQCRGQRIHPGKWAVLQSLRGSEGCDYIVWNCRYARWDLPFTLFSAADRSKVSDTT